MNPDEWDYDLENLGVLYWLNFLDKFKLFDETTPPHFDWGF